MPSFFVWVVPPGRDVGPPGQPPPNHQTIPTTSKTFHRSSPSTSSLDIGSWKFKSFRRGSEGSLGRSRVRKGGSRVGVKVCFVVFFGRGNMVIMDPEKICLPVIPVSQVKVLVFGFRMFLGGYKFWKHQVFRSLGDGWIGKTPQNWWWIYGVVVVFVETVFSKAAFAQIPSANERWSTFFGSSGQFYCCQTLLGGLSLLPSAKKKGRSRTLEQWTIAVTELDIDVWMK